MSKQIVSMRTKSNPAAISGGASWVVNCERDTHLDNLAPYDALRIDNRSAQPITVKVNQSEDLSVKQRAKTAVKFVAIGAIDGVSITNDSLVAISAGEIILSFIKGTPSQIGTLEEGGATTYVVDSTGAVIDPATSTNISALQTAVTNALAPLANDTVKGLLRSIGDAGDAPANSAGRTILDLLNSLYARINAPSSHVTLTTTPLGASATFTSPSYDFLGSRLSRAGFMGISDKASATNGVLCELSNDGTNWDYTGANTSATAGVGVGLSQEVVGKCIRFKWINGGTAQTYLRFGARFYV